MRCVTLVLSRKLRDNVEPQDVYKVQRTEGIRVFDGAFPYGLRELEKPHFAGPQFRVLGCSPAGYERVEQMRVVDSPLTLEKLDEPDDSASVLVLLRPRTQFRCERMRISLGRIPPAHVFTPEVLDVETCENRDVLFRLDPLQELKLRIYADFSRHFGRDAGVNCRPLVDELEVWNTEFGIFGTDLGRHANQTDELFRTIRRIG